jgi:hypothetical protein
MTLRWYADVRVVPRSTAMDSQVRLFSNTTIFPTGSTKSPQLLRDRGVARDITGPHEPVRAQYKVVRELYRSETLTIECINS